MYEAKNSYFHTFALTVKGLDHVILFYICWYLAQMVCETKFLRNVSDSVRCLQKLSCLQPFKWTLKSVRPDTFPLAAQQLSTLVFRCRYSTKLITWNYEMNRYLKLTGALRITVVATDAQTPCGLMWQAAFRSTRTRLIVSHPVAATKRGHAQYRSLITECISKCWLLRGQPSRWWWFNVLCCKAEKGKERHDNGEMRW